MQFEKWFNVDLAKPRQLIPDLGFPVFTGDNNSVRFGVNLFQNKEPIDASGTVVGYAILPNGMMVPPITGEKDGNKIWIDLPEIALKLTGRIQLAIRLIDGEEETVISAASATVRRVDSDTIIDPDDVVPTWEDILTKIAQMDAAADACNDAAEAAEDAAEGALANFAPAFAEATANVAGSYVTYTDGKMYLLPNGHTVNTTWANTTKSEVKVGGELTDLKGAFNPVQEAVSEEVETPITLTWYSGGHVWDKRDTSSTPREQTGYQAANAVHVQPGEKYKIEDVYCTNTTYRRGYLIYNSDFSQILKMADNQESSGQYDFEIEIPTDGAYLCINCNSSTSSYSAATTLTKIAVEYIDGIQMSEDVTELKNTAEETTGNTYNLFVHNITAETTTNGVTITPIDNSTVSIVTGENGATANTYVWGGELPAGTYFMHTDGLLKNKITVRHGSGYSVWKNNTSITLTGAENVYIRVESEAVIESAQTVRVTIVSGMYYKPYIEGGLLSAVDHEARAEAKNANSVSTGDIIADNLDARKWIVPAKYKLRFGTTTEDVPEADVLELLFFSDPHDDTNAVGRFLQFGGEVGCDMICAGDIVASYASSSSLNGWNGVPGVENIMLVPGNHDWYANSQYTEYITQADMESRLFGNASGWGVTRPENASYWYKDYANQKVRLIGLDSWLVYVDTSAYNSMITWLESALSGAKTAGYHVLIMNHTPPLTDNVTEIDCNFSEQIIDYSCRISSGAMDAYAASQSLPTISGTVHDFTEAGGKFICYLFGHIHRDYIGKLVNYSDQMFVVIGTANASIDDTNDVSRTGAGADLIDYIAIDTNKSLCKIIRIGASRTALMVERDKICFDYSTGTIMS